MQLVKICLIAFAILTLTACSEKECKPRVVEKTVEVLVEKKCIVPDVNCTAQGSDTEVISGLLKCIVDLKKASEVCK